MRSFKTSKVELFQLDPTPGFGLATPMCSDAYLVCTCKIVYVPKLFWPKKQSFTCLK